MSPFPMPGGRQWKTPQHNIYIYFEVQPMLNFTQCFKLGNNFETIVLFINCKQYKIYPFFHLGDIV